MKFRFIFILFNVVLVISFLVIYLMPLFILGWDYTKVFWANNWFLPVIFVAIIGVLNGYFAVNWRLFSLLEREDWDGLVRHLEHQIYSKRRLRKQYIRLLVNGYLVNSRTEKIEELESFLQANKPGLVRFFGLLFGIPRLLKNDPVELERFYKSVGDAGRPSDRAWNAWNHGFALMLLKRKDEARVELTRVAQSTKEPVLLLLSLYLLDAFADPDHEVQRVLEDGKSALKRRYNPTAWQKEIDRAKENVEVVVLTKLVQEATEWLFSFGNAGSAQTVH